MRIFSNYDDESIDGLFSLTLIGMTQIPLATETEAYFRACVGGVTGDKNQRCWLYLVRFATVDYEGGYLHTLHFEPLPVAQGEDELFNLETLINIFQESTVPV